MEPLEFLIPMRPVSSQARNRPLLRAWKDCVRASACHAWGANRAPTEFLPLQCTIVYLCSRSPADVDNIIKPIQDALAGVIFKNDFWITDVDAHRRFLHEQVNTALLPSLLKCAYCLGEECVFVRIRQAGNLVSYV